LNASIIVERFIGAPALIGGSILQRIAGTAAHENNSGRFHRNIRASAKGNYNIRLRDRRWIVHAIATHTFVV
jgi:hypothetical protein